MYVEIVFLMCWNIDNFHGECEFLLRYVILDGKFYDGPDPDFTKKLLADNPDVPVRLEISPCRSCRAKGVTGPNKSGYLDRD